MSAYAATMARMRVSKAALATLDVTCCGSCVLQLLFLRRACDATQDANGAPRACVISMWPMVTA
jgi:hypothetical protein